MKQGSYQKTQLGNGYLFNVTPAPKVTGGCAGVFLFVMLGFVGGLIIGMIFNELLGIVGGIGIIIYSFMKWDLRKKDHRNPTSFTVTPDSVEVNGAKIQKKDIHRIIIRNAYSNVPKIQLTGQTISTGTAMGHDLRVMLEQISNGVFVESGGRAYMLAGGLDEVTAFAIYSDINQILNFTNPPA